MTPDREWAWLEDVAAAFVCQRNVDYLIGVHVVGRVEDSAGAPVPGVRVYVVKTDQAPRDGNPRPLPLVGESAPDGALDLRFRYMWGRKVAWHEQSCAQDARFLLHYVHDDFGIVAVPVAASAAATEVVSETRVVLTRLSPREAEVVRRQGSRSQYLRKRDPDPGDPGESWDPDQPWPHEAPFGGDTFSIGGDCAEQTQRIVDGVRWAYWQLRDGKIVTDPGLRACIMDQMNNASLTCGGGSCNGAVNGYNDENLFFRSSNIVVCVPQVRLLSTPDIGRLAIHEWAHSCGWDHGDGKGVPGDSGVGLG